MNDYTRPRTIVEAVACVEITIRHIEDCGQR
jgi:hypothetical protein